MNIDIGGILSRSFQIVSQNRVLWALGLAVILFSSTINFNLAGGLSSFNARTGYNSDAAATAVGTSALGSCVTSILFLIFFLFLRPVFEAASIYAADHANQGSPPSFREAFTAGRTWMWRILGLNLIVFLMIIVVVVIVGIVMALLLGASFASLFAGLGSGASSASSATAASAAVGGFLLLTCLLIILGIPLVFVVNMILQLGERAIVLENCAVGQAWSRGWSLLRANLGSALLLVLVEFGILLVVGLVVGIIIFIATLPLLGLALSGGGLGLVVGLLGGILLWALTGLLAALPAAWNATLWTLFYRAVTGQALQPVGYPGGPGYPGGYPGQPPQGGYTQPGQYPGQPPQGGYTQPGQYPGGYAPPPQGGYTQPGQYPGGYAPPPPQGGYTQPGQYPGGAQADPYTGGYTPPPQSGYVQPGQYPGGYAPPSDSPPTQHFGPQAEGDDRARGGPAAGGQ